MNLFDWSFSFFSDHWNEVGLISFAFCFGNLLVDTFMRIAFAGRIRLKLRYRG